MQNFYHKHYKTDLQLYLTPGLFSCFLLVLFLLVVDSSSPAGLFFSLWSGCKQYDSLNPFNTLTWSCNMYKIGNIHLLLLDVQPLCSPSSPRNYPNHLLHQNLYLINILLRFWFWPWTISDLAFLPQSVHVKTSGPKQNEFLRTLCIGFSKLGSSTLHGQIWLWGFQHFLQLCWLFGFLLASKHTGRQVSAISASGSGCRLVSTKFWQWTSLICVFKEASVKWFSPQSMQLYHLGGSNTWIAASMWPSSSFSVLLSFPHCRQLYNFRLSSVSVCSWRIDWDGASRRVSVSRFSWDSWDFSWCSWDSSWNCSLDSFWDSWDTFWDFTGD